MYRASKAQLESPEILASQVSRESSGILVSRESPEILVSQARGSRYARFQNP